MIRLWLGCDIFHSLSNACTVSEKAWAYLHGICSFCLDGLDLSLLALQLSFEACQLVRDRCCEVSMAVGEGNEMLVSQELIGGTRTVSDDGMVSHATHSSKLLVS